MHAPHRLIHACTSCIAPWHHRPMHAVTAWALLFWFCLRYTSISSYFGFNVGMSHRHKRNRQLMLWLVHKLIYYCLVPYRWRGELANFLCWRVSSAAIVYGEFTSVDCLDCLEGVVAISNLFIFYVYGVSKLILLDVYELTPQSRIISLMNFRKVRSSKEPSSWGRR